MDEPAAGLRRSTPAGNVVDIEPLEGRCFNPATGYEFPHMLLAAYMVVGFARRLDLRGRDAARPPRSPATGSGC